MIAFQKNSSWHSISENIDRYQAQQNKLATEKPVLWQFPQQCSASTKIFGMHKENSTSIANFDKSVFADVSRDQNDRGPRRNGHYGPMILLRRNGSAPIS